MNEFRTAVLMKFSIGKSNYSKWGNPYEYPKQILDRNANIHHHNVVSSVIHHMDYI